MVSHLRRMFHRPAPSASTDPGLPSTQDLQPLLELALATLKSEHAAGRLSAYQQIGTHEWLIWLPRSVVEGGLRLTFYEWSLLFFASLWAHVQEETLTAQHNQPADALGHDWMVAGREHEA
jgi:hypothetical protein